ncbi:hypothetical protein CTI12_AA128220 [Artemisia annua]|uniref:Uncharacterized protein n=1 Tax=Artemisia annua TaxID=35608 RepID=A0A2U1PNM6_ARTAN|nr:hypothetical protein CTI12_AA128220 [Artemisia annua]
MPHKTRPMAALLLFTGLNVVLVSTITPVYDFVCFHPYWERRVSNCGDGVSTSLIHIASAVTKLFIYSISGLSDEVWRGVMNYLKGATNISLDVRLNCIARIWSIAIVQATVNLSIEVMVVKLSDSSSLINAQLFFHLISRFNGIPTSQHFEVPKSVFTSPEDVCCPKFGIVAHSTIQHDRTIT